LTREPGLQLGAIADDLTGATDLASALARAGLRVAMSVGIPPALPARLDAVVVALKIRSAGVTDAVTAAVQAGDYLAKAGAPRLYFKYSSTFDSGPRGNIGPVADALAERTGTALTVVCPAFPRLGRTVYQGHLFVGAELLERAGLGDHPLTPHHESSIVALMAAQTPHPVGLVALPTIRQGAAAISAAFATLSARGYRYAVTDAVEDADLSGLATACARHGLLTGSAGLAGALATLLGPAAQGDALAGWMPPGAGPVAILSGSCSEVTRRQVAAFARHGPVLRLDADRLSARTASDAAGWAARHLAHSAVLVSSLRSDDDQPAAGPRSAAAVEEVLSEIARELYRRGFRRFVVAGGETSGAVVAGLGLQLLEVGPELSAGVSWLAGGSEREILLALKSGNFGDDDLFVRAATGPPWP
jgi:3-dehydrotetronate 4-kinase